ncbi:MAG: C10 family peptidase [Bacteroidaceae bacterium]|nr:C10 family peptidase [Bacteroidaceae bacterium]
MRRIFGIWLLLLPMVLMAAPVTQEQAMQRAREFVNKRPQMAQGGKLRAARAPLKLQSAQATASYYVFNVGEQQGFVIASGDDRTPAILGYADDGQFDADNIPTNMQAWLEDYERQISLLDKYPAAQATSYEAVDPLLITTWSQDAPYNLLCPMVDGIQAPTGCAATALAQVLNYYKYPAQTTKPIPAYTTMTSEIDMPEIPVTDIDWDNILDNYNGGATAAQYEAVATLMMLCGQALEMDYCADASASNMYKEFIALRNYFGYDETARYVMRSDFSASEWENLIYDELYNGRPVIYGGQSTTLGHGFIVDGYDGDGLFHINWGWGGIYDGYFLLSVLNPYNDASIGTSGTRDGFSIGQEAVVGIQHSTGEKFDERFYVGAITNNGEKSYTRTSPSVDFPELAISIKGDVVTSEPQVFSFGLELYKSDGEAVQLLASCSTELSSYLIENHEVAFEPFSFGADLADGDYYLTPVSRPENAEDWEPCWGANVSRIKATISGNTLTLTEPRIDLSGKFIPADSIMAYTTVRVEAQITNNGTDFNKYIFLSVDSTIVGGRILELKAGETATFSIEFVPTTTGTKALTLYYRMNGEYVPFVTDSINIVGQVEGEPQMTGSITLTNVNSEGNVEEPTINMSVEFQNIGDGPLVNSWGLVVLMKHDPETQENQILTYEAKPITLAAGCTTSFNASFKNLEFGSSYRVALSYLPTGSYAYLFIIESMVPFDVVDPTSINTLPTTTLPFDVYTTAGAKVRSQVTTLEGLPKGVYIVNKKKILRE